MQPRLPVNGNDKTYSLSPLVRFVTVAWLLFKPVPAGLFFAMEQELPRYVQNILSSGPPESGIHKWLYSTSCVLHEFWPEPDIMSYLWSVTRKCRRFVSRREIVEAVQDSADRAKEAGINYAPQSAWPKVDDDRRAAILKDGIEMVDLWEMSPWRFQDEKTPDTEMLIDCLFPGNPFLSCSHDEKPGDCLLREEWRGQMSQLQFLVPSPMRGRFAPTKRGTQSTHALAGVGDRRFLVLEFDIGSVDEHASILVYLKNVAPLVMVVHSGGKSLHGWFHCQNQVESSLGAFMRFAVSLGADSVTWSKAQFVRMPEGTRANGNPQHVYYFDPERIREEDNGLGR